MRKKNKILCVVILVCICVVAYTIPYIKMEFAGSAHYTEQDRREYNFYTPDILKGMPRISDHYDFDFSNTTGPANQVNAIKFYGTEDIRIIDSYLASLGYKKKEKCDIEATCWKGTDPQETIYVGILKSEKIVIIQVVMDFS
ncbi:hypothetical protein [Mangrovibacter plantisponsor]|uniref:Uncharacterized protein n=1 Tax=Mangrovibacter plantisponsor TaxID=451513 RepID=A0A317Q7K5_9ENTR|nr:hypothetical protein [Mangrovibacter plantisponsor]PWW10130.1 hypothetical protein DES37_104231 [Mangrovibacter plantisponsor]